MIMSAAPVDHSVPVETKPPLLVYGPLIPRSAARLAHSGILRRSFSDSPARWRRFPEKLQLSTKSAPENRLLEILVPVTAGTNS